MFLKSSNFSQRWHFWGLHSGGKGARSGLYGGWGRTVHSSFVIASCIFVLVCGHASSCWRRISTTFLWGQTLLKWFYKVLRVWIYRFELMVWPHGMSTKITPFASLNRGVMTVPAEGVVLNFIFQDEVGWWHSTDSFCVCSSRSWIHVSFPLTIFDKKLSLSAF